MKIQIKLASLSAAVAVSLLTPANADIIAYEGLNYGVGVSLSAQTQPAQFDAWNRNIIASPGYTTVAGSLAYTNGGALTTTGNALTGGNAYETCGMRINLASSYDIPKYNAAWTPYKVDVPNKWGGTTPVIGEDNTTMYVSFLMNSTSDNANFGLYTDGYIGSDPWGQMGVGTTLKVTAEGAVSLRVGSYTYGAFDSVNNNGTDGDPANHAIQDVTATAVTAGSTNLYVLKIEFGASGNGQDKVSLFQNPTVGGTEPGAANASITATGNLVFSAIGIYLGNQAGKGQFDELRFGSAWADVVPSSAPPLTGFAAWANSHGLPTDGTGNGAPSEILAGDGITNLMKYALGIDPLVSGYQGRLTSGKVTDSGSDYLNITYIRPDPAPIGLSYVPEASPDLFTWSTAGIVSTPSTPSGGLCTVSVRDNTAIGSETRRFLRVKAVVSP
jgi:hypothetical protein